MVDALGNLVRFTLMPGQRFDGLGVAVLIEDVAFDAFLADKAFDSDALVAELKERGVTVCISQRPNRIAPLEIDEEMYKWRHLIENFFGKLKEFKRISTRSDKTDTVFKAMVYAASGLINAR